ncbi:MAG TPA: cbb3-type cytochrome c oxidase subunit I [Mycobacteriales bacterium]|nr:cbb3-type cytochrome c oxidase subunit I [Mycobacteriales bacterium]
MALATTAAPAETNADARSRSWEQPSGAALTWLTVGAAFLLLGAALTLVTAIQLVSPGWGTLGPATSIGRLRPVATTIVGFGGLGMIGTGVALDLARRLGRAPAQLDLLAKAGGALVTLSVAAGSIALLMGHSTGRPGLELPRLFSVPLALGLLLAAAAFFRTMAMRESDDLHPALWHLSAGVLAGPLLLLLGSLPRVAGVNDEVVRVFATNGLLLLWLVSLGIGIALYVVPQAARTALYSRRLAAIGFWGWVAIAPLTGAARLVSGPAQEWLETIGIASMIALVVPALAVCVNLSKTYTRRTSLAHPADLRSALLGAALLALSSVLGAVTAGRTAGDVLHLTVFADGKAEMMAAGVAGSLILAGLWHVLPALSGRRQANPMLAARSTWWLGAGVLLVAASLLAAGFVQGALWTESVREGGTAFTGAGWRVVADSIRPLLWARVIGQALLLATAVLVFQQVLATTAYGEPLDRDDAAHPQAREG